VRFILVVIEAQKSGISPLTWSYQSPNYYDRLKLMGTGPLKALVTITAVSALGLCFSGEAMAAGRGAPDDGPYYVTDWGNRLYVECGAPRIYDNTDGPVPYSTYGGALGYRCIKGTYAYDPFYPPRCRIDYIRTSNGWQPERHCF